MTTYMENVSTGVLDKKNKEHYLRYKEKAKILYVLRHMRLHMSKYQ